MPSTTKQDLLFQLQRDILTLQGTRPSNSGSVDLGLGPILEAFPGNVFPTAAVHELVGARPLDVPAACGFAAGLISGLMKPGGACIWVSCGRKIYPPGLQAFGIEPDRVVFMDMRNDKEVLWATEEALKCDGLAAVVGEIRDLTMTVSRRFQLAVEHSRVTGFVLRHQPRSLHPTAAVARWNITHLPSEVEAGMPGVGFPRWNIELTRIRNGRPGVWQTEWQAGRFQFVPPQVLTLRRDRQRKTG